MVLNKMEIAKCMSSRWSCSGRAVARGVALVVGTTFVMSGGSSEAQRFVASEICANAFPFAINDSGQITGSYGSGPNWGGFIYSALNNAFQPINPPNGNDVNPLGINQAGEVVGNYQDYSSGTDGFTYSDEFVDFGAFLNSTLPNFTFGVNAVMATNNYGNLAGFYIGSGISTNGEPSGVASGFYWDGEYFYLMGEDFDGTLGYWANCWTHGVNDSGLVVGEYSSEDGSQYYPYAWLPDLDLDYDIVMPLKLPNNDGGGAAVAVNNSGEIVCSQSHADGSLTAFTCSTTQFIDTNLGSLGGRYTYPAAINESGFVCGESSLGASSDLHAFFYDPGSPSTFGSPTPAIFDLDDHLAQGPAAYSNLSSTDIIDQSDLLTNATALNNVGQIVAESKAGNCYLLTISGLDISSTSYSSTKSWNDWSELAGEGVPFAIVRCWRSNDQPDSPSAKSPVYPGAAALLEGASTQGIPIAGYLYMNFNGTLTGWQEMKGAMTAAGRQLHNLSFMAIDVETVDENETFTHQEQEDNLVQIKSAIGYAVQHGLAAVIYTYADAWNRIIGPLANNDDTIRKTPLWQSKPDGLADLSYDWNGVSEVCFHGMKTRSGDQLGPWTSRIGKQFWNGPTEYGAIGEPPLVGSAPPMTSQGYHYMLIDDDLFDPSLFNVPQRVKGLP